MTDHPKTLISGTPPPPEPDTSVETGPRPRTPLHRPSVHEAKTVIGGSPAPFADPQGQQGHHHHQHGQPPAQTLHPPRRPAMPTRTEISGPPPAMPRPMGPPAEAPRAPAAKPRFHDRTRTEMTSPEGYQPATPVQPPTPEEIEIDVEVEVPEPAPSTPRTGSGSQGTRIRIDVPSIIVGTPAPKVAAPKVSAPTPAASATVASVPDPASEPDPASAPAKAPLPPTEPRSVSTARPQTALGYDELSGTQTQLGEPVAPYLDPADDPARASEGSPRKKRSRRSSKQGGRTAVESQTKKQSSGFLGILAVSAAALATVAVAIRVLGIGGSGAGTPPGATPGTPAQGSARQSVQAAQKPSNTTAPAPSAAPPEPQQGGPGSQQRSLASSVAQAGTDNPTPQASANTPARLPTTRPSSKPAGAARSGSPATSAGAAAAAALVAPPPDEALARARKELAKLELSAVEALMANDLKRALEAYSRLAAAAPNVPAFSTMYRYLTAPQSKCPKGEACED